jgi:hypothetical protein
LEALLEIVGALIGLKVAWAFAEGGAMDVDQASALLVVAVLAGRLMVKGARQCWAVHREGKPARAFPPDR